MSRGEDEYNKTVKLLNLTDRGNRTREKRTGKG